jgi:CheY-like chemotaxis protein
MQATMNACPPSPAPQPAGAVSPPRWFDWRGSGCILVVEDDEFIRTLVSRTVTRLGFITREANDGLRAVAQFAADPGLYTLVLLDFNLPGIDGKETLARLRRLRPDVRAILMSGLPRHEAMGQFSGRGPAGFLPKPFTIEAIASELRAVLEA